MTGPDLSTPPARLARLEGGQATVELLGGIPAMLVLGVVVFHVLAVGYASVLAGSAAEAGALALAAGRDPEQSAREALPEAARDDLRVAASRSRVEVRLAPPMFIDAVARRVEVRAAAAVAE